MSKEILFSSPRSRTLAATLGVLLAAVLMTAGMTTYLPLSQTDSITLPIILFPVTWVLLFLWACFDSRLWRVWSVLLGLSCGHLLLILSSIGML